MLIQLIVFGGGLAIGYKSNNLLNKTNKKTNKQIRPVLEKKQPHSVLEQKTASLYGKSRESLQGIKNAIKISIKGSGLQREQLGMIATSQEHSLKTAEEIKLNKNIKRSVGLIGLALAGTWLYAPLLPIAGLGTLYIFSPVLKRFYQNIKQGRITTEFIETVSVVGLLATGYYFLAIVITFTSLLCMKLLMLTEQKSHKQLISIFNQNQHRVWVVKESSEIEVPIENVQLTDIVVVNAGELIPIDGIVTEGWATIDQHKLTGESRPVEVEKGMNVFAPTLVLAGRILIKVEKTGSNTTASKIVSMLEQTQEYKETQQLRGKQIADSFIAPTLITSGITLPLLGPSAALAVIWTAFGYNMKLYGPISVLNYLHIMAKNGILIKDGRSLEMLQKIDTLVFDKTGTLTMEQPQLAGLHPLKAYDEETLLRYAAAAEYRQTHPIAKAILAAAKQYGLELPTIGNAVYQVGYGIEVTIDSKTVQVGSIRYIKQHNIPVPKAIDALSAQCDTKGHLLTYVAVEGQLIGAVELQPRIRPEAKEIIDYVKSQGISVCIISGDHTHPTRRLAEQLGIENYFAEVLPDKKAELIANLRANGKFVAYVGDGINDAIALKQANVSISLQGASNIATDTAQIILMDGDLKKIKALFDLSKSFESNMRTSYVTSLLPGAITLTGVFFFNMGLVGSLVVYFGAKAFGLTNVMQPLIRIENKD